MKSESLVPETPSTRATEAVARLGIAHRLSIIGSVSNALEAAAARGVPVGALVKTMVVRRGDEDYVLVLVPGDRVIDWPKLRAVLGVNRLAMPSADEALAATGYARGTITPFGADSGWPIVMDASFEMYDEVALGGGGDGVGIHLHPSEISRVFEVRRADITKPGNL